MLLEAVHHPTQASTEDSVSALLRRISRSEDPNENVELAWRLFREAREEHISALLHELPRHPTETKPIVAATVARLEGRDPVDAFERYRSKGAYTATRIAADALGRYLSDPELSGPEKARENLVSALGHREPRVRRAALAELKRRNDPRTPEILLSLVLEEYPRSSPRTKTRRWLWIALLRGLAYSPMFLGSFSRREIGALLAVLGFVLSIILVTVLEAWLLKGADRLGDEAQTEILEFIANYDSYRPIAMLDKVPELRAISSGIRQSKGSRRAASRVIDRIETASKPLQDLPVAAEGGPTTGNDLPRVVE